MSLHPEVAKAFPGNLMAAAESAVTTSKAIKIVEGLKNLNPMVKFKQDLNQIGMDINHGVITKHQVVGTLVEWLDTDRIVVNLNGKQQTTTFTQLLTKLKKKV